MAIIGGIHIGISHFQTHQFCQLEWCSIPLFWWKSSNLFRYIDDSHLNEGGIALRVDRAQFHLWRLTGMCPYWYRNSQKDTEKSAKMMAEFDVPVFSGVVIFHEHGDGIQLHKYGKWKRSPTKIEIGHQNGNSQTLVQDLFDSGRDQLKFESSETVYSRCTLQKARTSFMSYWGNTLMIAWFPD